MKFSKNIILKSAIYFFFALTLLLQIFMLIFLYRLNILPLKLFILVSALFAILSAAAVLLIALKSKSKKGSILKLCFAFLLCLVLACVSSFGIFSMHKLSDTMNEITTEELPLKTVEMKVYVSNASSAKNIHDAKDFQFGTGTHWDDAEYAQAIAQIEKELQVKIKIKSYEHMYDMVVDLIEGRLDCMIINNERLKIINDVTVHNNLHYLINSIYTCEIKEELKDNSYNYKKCNPVAEPFIVYISGIDARDKKPNPANFLKIEESRSDVNILAVVNPVSKEILLLNTPRDYFIPNTSLNNLPDKLSHMGLYSTDCSVDSLDSFYGIASSYYIKINFNGFQKLIDAIGGVDIYSPIAFTTHHGKYPVKVGINHFNGDQALCFVRERYALPGGDNDRGKNQMKVITAIVNKLSASTLISNYSSLMDSAKGMFKTNMHMSDISHIVKMQLSDMASWNITSYAVSGKGGMDFPASMYGAKAYVTYPDKTSVEKAKELINMVYLGERISKSDF